MAMMAGMLPSLLGGLASTLIGSMLKDDAPAPQAAAPAAPIVPPTVEEPTPMPTANSQETRAAQRRSVATQLSRRGRASTILTDNADAKLGG